MKFLATAIFCCCMLAAHAGDGPTYIAIQDGARLIEIDGKAASGKTVLICNVFEGDLKTPTTKEITINGISGKSVQAVGYHSMNDHSKLLYIEVSIREKMLSKSGVSVWLSPSLEILNQYNFDWSDNSPKSKPHDKSFFNANMPCFPTDHIMGAALSVDIERDAWLDAGSKVYLHYDFNALERKSPEDRFPKSKSPASVNSELYCITGSKEGIKKTWSLNIEEERIMFYQFECSDGKVFLFTTYLKGNTPGGSEEVESRIRMIDGASGEVVYNVVVEPKSGFEMLLSGLYYDSPGGNLYWAGNYVSWTTKPWKKNEGETNSYFVIGKISSKGEAITRSLENSWTASEATARNVSCPLLMVRAMGMTKSGDLVVAGIHTYWVGDCSATNYPNAEGITSMTFGCQGAQVLYFTGSLEKIASEQLIVPSPGLKDPIFYSVQCDLDAICYNSDAGENAQCTKARWNSETETMTVLQGRISVGLSTVSTEYFAISVKKGEKARVRSLGKIGESNSSLGPGYILADDRSAVRLNRMSRSVESVMH